MGYTHARCLLSQIRTRPCERVPCLPAETPGALRLVHVGRAACTQKWLYGATPREAAAVTGRQHISGAPHAPSLSASNPRARHGRPEPERLRSMRRSATRHAHSLHKRARSSCSQNPNAIGQRACSASTPSSRRSTTPVPPVASRHRPTWRLRRRPWMPPPLISVAGG
jgi:hypothetical protein